MVEKFRGKKEASSGNVKGIVAGLILGLIVGFLAGYFSHNIISGNRLGRGNFASFELDDNTKQQITQFFESNPSQEQVNSYCQDNRMYCAYYCRSINPDYQACSSIMNFTRQEGGRQWSQ
jgi:hypothetical protein